MKEPESVSFIYSGLRQRLDRAVHTYLLSSGNSISRSQVKKIIESGQVTVDGRVCDKAGTEIENGAQLSIKILSEPAPSYLVPFDFKLDLIYEDQDLIVINKPAGLSVHPGAGQRDRTLVNALVGHLDLDQFGDIQRPGIVHRLDKDTTGLMVVAKNVPALANLSAQFAKKSAIRKYKALCSTSPRARGELAKADAGTISLAIARHPVRRKEFTVVEHGGRSATSHWRVLTRMSYALLLELQLQTGRTHQIRVHLAHLKNPIIGDRVYGDLSSLPSGLRTLSEEFGRQALHAYHLELTHPRTAQRMLFNVDLPADMVKLIELFKGPDQQR